jgi:hypothetical protein
MTNNFSHLVVNGCSFTYCEGLRYPLLEGWPKLLAEKLDVPLINLAKPGTGNDRIVRTTVEHIYKNPLPNPLYIIAFSHSSRREEYYRFFRGAPLNDYQQLHFNQPKDLTESVRFFVENYNPIVYSQKKIRLWLSIVNTFKANNISYLTTDFIPDLTKDIIKLKSSYGELLDAVNNDPNRLVNLEQLTRDIAKLPCGHEDYPAMPVLANYIHEEIRKRWH